MRQAHRESLNRFSDPWMLKWVVNPFSARAAIAYSHSLYRAEDRGQLGSARRIYGI